MRFLLLLILFTSVDAFFTNDEIIKREIRDCFDTAFGFNARRVTETSSSEEMYRQLDACLRLNPLYVEHDDFAKNQVETLIADLEVDIGDLFEVKRVFDAKYDIYLRHVHSFMRDTRTAIDSQYSAAASMLSSDITVQWDSATVGSMENIFASVEGGLNETYTELEDDINVIDTLLSDPVIRDTQELLSLADTYDTRLKAVMDLRASLRTREAAVINAVIAHFKSIGFSN